MSPWPEILRDIHSELKRCSQLVEGRSVIPNSIVVRLPRGEFGRYAPVLEPVTRELGDALVVWARAAPHEWATDAGPFLEVVLADRPDREVVVEIADRG